MRESQQDRRSLWWGLRGEGVPGGAGAQAQAAPPAGRLPAEVDVLVVGAGITGLATAVELARAGRAPLVVEARRAGAGTTGHSTAKVSLLQGSMLSRLRRHASDDTVRAYVDASRAGQAWVLDLLQRRGVEAERRDAVTYAVTPAGARQVAAEREAARAVGLPVTDPLVTGPAGAGLPFEVVDAIGLPGQVQVDPLALLEALRAELLSLGGRLVEGVRVTGLSARRPWRVTTSAGEIGAGHVVLATQAPIVDRSGHTAALQANRSYALAYPVAEGTDLPMALSLDDPTRSLRTATTKEGTFVLVGGSGHKVGVGTESEHVAELDAWARAALGVGEPAWSWSAQDYQLTTQVPSVGPVPLTDNTLLVATGYDKWGMTSGAAAGQILAGDILGEVPSFAPGLRGGGPTLADAAKTVAHGVTTGARLLGDRVAAALPTGGPGAPAEGQGRLEGSPASPTAVSTVDGRTCRVSGVCTHLGGILAWNDAERSWDCPLHGSRFAPDGALIEGPATTDLPGRD